MRYLSILALIGCTACDPQVMTISGRSFLDAREAPTLSIVEAASYEPNLKFPARIGVVRLVSGSVTVVPDEERSLFSNAFSGDLGTVVELGPLEARMLGLRNFGVGQDEIRKLAASRHLDYVLVVELAPAANTAEAIFLGVRNGYPYASVETRIPGPVATNLWGRPTRNHNRIDRISRRLAQAIRPELSEMMAALAEVQR
ncbi:MAG: hypothetical protein AAGF13_03475 [Pseudomonadota bacterium]